MDKLFALTKHGTSVKGEFRAGIIGFFTLIYVVIINAQVLNVTGVPFESGIISSVLATALGTILVGIFLNVPFQIAPAMGINAFFAYGLVMTKTLTLSEAFTAITISGLLVLILSLTPILNYLNSSLSENFKLATRSGIGLYLILLGMESSNLVKINQHQFLKFSSFSNINVLLVLGLLIFGIIMSLKTIKMNYFIVIVLGSVLFLVFGLSKIHLESTRGIWSAYEKIILPITNSGLAKPHFWGAVLSITLTIIFETIGTVPIQLEEINNTETSINKIGFFIGLSTIFASLLGTTATISALESDSAISAGGKTGLTNIFIGLFFCTSLLMLPLYSFVAPLATTPVLILIGINMFKSIADINITNDKPNIFATILMITMIPFSFSITTGMGIGFISYIIIKIAIGEAKKVSSANWIISLLYLLMFLIQSFS